MEFNLVAEPAGLGDNINPAFIKILEIHYEGKVQLTGLTDLNGHTYAALETEIRSLFPNSIFRDDCIKMYLTEEPRSESLIRNDADVGIVINFPGFKSIIYVTAFMPMNALRTRVVRLNHQIRSLEDNVTRIFRLLGRNPLRTTSRGRGRSSQASGTAGTGQQGRASRRM